jgi:hypothetical protein
VSHREDPGETTASSARVTPRTYERMPAGAEERAESVGRRWVLPPPSCTCGGSSPLPLHVLCRAGRASPIGTEFLPKRWTVDGSRIAVSCTTSSYDCTACGVFQPRRSLPPMSEMDVADGGDVPPNQTIYINRLNEKVKKDGDANPPSLLSPPCVPPLLPCAPSLGERQ